MQKNYLVIFVRYHGQSYSFIKYNNPEVPLLESISGKFEGLMRPRHMETWGSVRDAVELAQKVRYLYLLL